MLVVFLIVALALLLYINYKFNTLNKKIISLQSQLQRLSEQVASHQNNLAEKESARAVDDSISPPYVSPEKEVTIAGDEARAEHNNQQSIAQVINTTNPISNDNGTTDKTVTESQPVPEEYYIVETAEQNPSAENSTPITATSALTNASAKSRRVEDSLALAAKSSHEKLQPDEQSTAIVTSVMRSLKNWFFGGNLVVRVGVIVLLIGVVLLLRLLSDYIEISIELKLIAIGTIGLAIAGLGLKLVKNRFTYGMTLQGAGLAIAYLSTFFAYQVYGVLPSLPSFVLLGTLSALTVILAVRQNAFPLALLAFSGAFLAPLLTSNNSGSLTTLFSYYLLLNIAIAVIAHYRTWKVLNLLAAAVTFGFAYFLGLVDSFTTVDDFNAQRWPLVGLVTLHWLLYVFVVIRYTQQLLTYNEQLAINPSSNDLNHELIQSAAEDSKPSFSHFSSYKASSYKNSNTAFIIPIDVSLMFGVPLLAFGLLSALLSDIDNALTIASAVIAATYLGLGSFFVLKDKNNANQNRYTPLIEGMLALGFGFFALMIAIAFDAEWTACGWSIQGLALVWFGRQSLRGWTVLLGVLLQGLALASLQPLFDYYSAPAPSTLSLTISAVGCLASVFILRNENNPIQPNYEVPDKEQQLLASVNTKSPIFQLIWSNSFVDMLSVVSMIWGLIVTAVIIDDYIGNWLDSLTRVIACALLINLIGYLVIDKYRQWNIVTNISHAFLGLFYLALLATVSFYFEYDDATTSSFWPLFIVLVAGWLLVGQLWIKRWYYANNPTSFDTMAWLMTGTILIAQLSYYLLPHSKGVMTVLITGIWLIALTQLCLRKKLNTPTWFNWQSALLGCALLFIPLSVTWAIYSNWTHDGIVWGLAYLPVLNLYDLSLITVLAYLISTHYLSIGQNQKLLEDHNLLLKVAGLLGFWLLSSLLIRTLYAYLGTPLWYQGAWFNEQVQTALTIFWTLTALVLTIISSRYQKRFWWFMGIGLLGIVVLKLVVIDLSQTDTIWRVVSFLGAGSLILLIGYLAPLPPEQDENKTKLELETEEDHSN